MGFVGSAGLTGVAGVAGADGAWASALPQASAKHVARLAKEIRVRKRLLLECRAVMVAQLDASKGIATGALHAFTCGCTALQ